MMRRLFVVFLVAFALSLVFCMAAIPLLRRLKAGQNILSYVKEHKDKSGTPTMGGLAFLPAACIAAAAFARGADKPFWISLAVGLGYLLVGFLDDLLKKLRGTNLGLRPYQKIFFQLAVALIAGVACCTQGYTLLRIPYTQISFDIGWWMFPLGLFVFLATVNSVNLTDGLDGLAGSVSMCFFSTLGALIFLQDGGSSSLLAIALSGALAAYLIFNTARASIFMGDTGSLSLGGFSASLALFSGNALILPLAGFAFVLSSISVILQVIYYKKTGKRIFRMAPIHHHFQQKGYAESKISYTYAVLTAVVGATLILPLV